MNAQPPPPPPYGNPPQPQPLYAAPPPKRTSPVVWVLLGAVGICALGSCGVLGITFLGRSATTTTIRPAAFAPTQATAGDVTTSTTPAAPAGPGMSRAEAAPIGTPVVAAKGWTVGVLDVADLDGDAEAVDANQFNEPKAGTRYVLVLVGIRNESGEVGSPGLNVRLSLVGPNGVSIDETGAAGLSPDYDAFTDVQAGGEMRGLAAFEVPLDQITAELVLIAEPQFTMDKAKDQRFLAIQ